MTGPRLSAEQFLSRLPPSVVKGGRVLDIRCEVSATLKGSSSSSSSSLTLLQTPALDHLRSRYCGLLSLLLYGDSLALLWGSPSLTTLKVRSESGDHTYLLKMRTDETIGDIWTHLLSQTPPTSISTSSGYQLVAGVTHHVYSDLSASLADCGLVPNATLYITKTTSGLRGNNSFTSFSSQ